MSRLFVSFVALMFTAATIQAQTASELELKAKAYLLLSTKQTPVELPNDCGECRFDENEARAVAKKLKKPLVIFVGSCRGLGKVALSNGAEAVIVAEYAGDKTPRAVILSAEGEKWYIHGELKKDATEKELLDVLHKVAPTTTKAIDWYLLQDCPTCKIR
jgi:hypothetical protein